MKLHGRIMASGALAVVAGAAFLAAASPKSTAAAADPLDKALEQRASGKTSPNDVEIDASWQLPEGNRSAHIWGNGVGIWQESVQFHLSHEQVLALVKMLADAKVGTMPQPGAKAPVVPSPRAPKAPLQLRGELTVVAGDVRTHFQQLTRGEQSQPLADLVSRILEIAQKAVSTDGVRAATLQDGLAKVVAGTLAPQTFTASVRRQAAPEKEGEVPEGWLLRIQGRHVSDRLMPKGQLPPPPRELLLSEADFRKLVESVRADDPTSFPNNTYAPAYTEVTVAVLDHRKNVPARPYLDVTPETHGEKQKSFDRLYEAFRAIHEKVQSQGTAAKGARPAAKAAPIAPAVPKH